MKKHCMKFGGHGHPRRKMLKKMLKREVVMTSMIYEPVFQGHHSDHHHMKHGFPWMRPKYHGYDGFRKHHFKGHHHDFRKHGLSDQHGHCGLVKRCQRECCQHIHGPMLGQHDSCHDVADSNQDAHAQEEQNGSLADNGITCLTRHFPRHSFHGHGFRKDGIHKCCSRNRGQFECGHHKHGHGVEPMLDQHDSCNDDDNNQDVHAQEGKNDAPADDGTGCLTHHFPRHRFNGHGFRRHGIHKCFSRNRGQFERGHHKHGHDTDSMSEQHGSCHDVSESDHDTHTQEGQNDAPADNGTGCRARHFPGHRFHGHGFRKHKFCSKSRDQSKHGQHKHVCCWIIGQHGSCQNDENRRNTDDIGEPRQGTDDAGKSRHGTDETQQVPSETPATNEIEMVGEPSTSKE